MRQLLLVTVLVAAASAGLVSHKSSSAGGTSENGSVVHTQRETSSTFGAELGNRGSFGSRRQATPPPDDADEQPSRRPQSRPTTTTNRRPVTDRPTTAPATRPAAVGPATVQQQFPLFSIPQIPTFRPFGAPANSASSIGNRINTNNRRPAGPTITQQLADRLSAITSQLQSTSESLGR